MIETFISQGGAGDLWRLFLVVVIVVGLIAFARQIVRLRREMRDRG